MLPSNPIDEYIEVLCDYNTCKNCDMPESQCTCETWICSICEREFADCDCRIEDYNNSNLKSSVVLNRQIEINNNFFQ